MWVDYHHTTNVISNHHTIRRGGVPKKSPKDVLVSTQGLPK